MRTPHPILGLAILLASTVASVNPSFAQQPGAQPPGRAPAPNAAAIADAAVYFKIGVEAAAAGDWPRAYEAFLAAWKLKRHHQIAAQLARAEIQLGKHRDAAEHLAFVLREAKDLSPEDRATIQRLLHHATGKIATLYIKVNREGADVLIDGAAVGVSPMAREVYVEPGIRTIEARLTGEATQKVPLELSPGQSRQVGLTFGEGSAAENAGGAAPVTLPPPEGGPRTAVLIAGSATAGAALISGFVFTGLANEVEIDTENNQCFGSGAIPKDECNDERDRRNRQGVFSNVAVWSLLGAGLVGAGTVLYAFLAPGGAPQQAGVQLVPVMAERGGGLLVAGQW